MMNELSINSTANNIENDLNKTGSSSDSKASNNCNLIVNYLPQSLKEHDFNALFSKIGALKTCKLMFDRQTGYSFGYGFVEFMNETDAQKAIDTFNGYQLEHKRLKVALARPNCEDTKNTNLYIRNIPVTYDEAQLTEVFAAYGDVVQVRLLRDQSTSFSRRIGFVIMSTKPMAQLAIQHLDNTIPNGATEPIYVKYADEEGKKRHGPTQNRDRGGLYGGNGPNLQNFQNSNFMGQQQQQHGFNNFNNSQFMMGNNQQQQQSQQQLNQLNNLNLGKMKNNRSNGQNRYNPIGGTTGFDNLINTIGTGNNNSMAGNNLYNQANNFGHQGSNQNQQIQQQHFGINNSNPTSLLDLNIGNGGIKTNDNNNTNGNIIYVYGISQANESDLFSLFNNCGRILRVNVIKNQKTGQCKGYGFVVFDTYDEAFYAVNNMNGYMFNNRPLQVQLYAGHIE